MDPKVQLAFMKSGKTKRGLPFLGCPFGVGRLLLLPLRETRPDGSDYVLYYVPQVGLKPAGDGDQHE